MSIGKQRVAGFAIVAAVIVGGVMLLRWNPLVPVSKGSAELKGDESARTESLGPSALPSPQPAPPAPPVAQDDNPGQSDSQMSDTQAGTTGEKLDSRSANYTKAQREGVKLKGRSSPFDPGNLMPLAKLKQGDNVVIPLFGGEQVSGKVNLVQEEAGGWVRVGGELAGTNTGTFFFGTSGEHVVGTVLLPKAEIAYVIEGQPGGQVFMEEKPLSEVICFPLPRPKDEPVSAAGDDGPQEIPPILSSRPGATAVVYLDFDGETVTDPSWNGGNTIVAQPSALTSAQISEVWNRVKEDFWPFNIDVTTDRSRYDNAPIGFRMRCIITPTCEWYQNCGLGGVARLNSFDEAGSWYSSTIPCWVFNSGVGSVAEAISHELGHTLGLSHDGCSSPVEVYYEGHGAGAVGWAPIMGVGYYKQLVQWSKGEYANANNQEDDLAIIANTAGFGYVADEAGNLMGSAAPLNVSGGAVNQTGIISGNNDVDYYSFPAGSGPVSLNAIPAINSPNLDIRLHLLDSAGFVMANSNPDTGLDAAVSYTVTAGTYYIKVEGTGRGAVTGDEYSSYGSMGHYSLSGTVPLIPPAVITPPLSQTVVAGGTATFSVEASGSQPLRYQWRRNGGNIAGATNAYYTISNVLTIQEGSYTVVVSNARASVTSANAVLTVNVPPSITSQPQSRIVNAGSSVTISVVASGTAPLSYQWYRNNSSIAGATASSYPISGVQPTNAGSYKVRVSNTVGAVDSTNATLTVQYKPVITSQPQSQAVIAGNVASFVVIADGVPSPTYQWKFNGVNIVGATSNTYTRTNVQPTNAGSYTVAVSNSLGVTNSQAAALTVIVPPAITAQPQSQVVTAGSSVSLFVTASSTAPLSYQWYRSNSPIAGATASSYTISGVQPTHAGNYKVRVSNSAGTVDSTNATLTVHYAPVIVSQPLGQMVIAGSSIGFSVVADGVPSPTYQWHFNNSPIPGANSPAYTVASAQPSNAGSYMVVVSNTSGTVTSDTANLVVPAPPFITISRPGGGLVQLTITGTVGAVYSIEYVSDLLQTNGWRCLDLLQLAAAEQSWMDPTVPVRGQRFYRVAVTAPKDMVFIQPGTFTMGSPANEVDRNPDEGPETTVTLSRGFWMGKCEVTQREYQAVVGSNPSHFSGDLSRPVETVSWHDATNYCGLLTQRERAAGLIPADFEYRLPTEAEWEYACRAGTTTRYSHGEDPGYANLNNYAWFGDNGSLMTHPVGQKLPNPWGLYDMHGNIFEWCQDWSGPYPGGTAINPQGPVTGTVRVLRGGGWSEPASGCRSAGRGNYRPDVRAVYFGFRVVLVPRAAVPGDMVFIQPGTFTMGSPTNEVDRNPDEGPQITVTLSRGFWMGKCEVTQREYQAVVGSNPSQFSGDLNRPVESVSWHDATNYCGLLTQRDRAAGLIPTDFEYRLPTEAEWEYVCRAGTTTRYSHGEDPGYTNLNKYAWYSGNSGGTTHPVEQKLPNRWGLYDMQGNAFEWCQDWHGSYNGGSAIDPQGPATGSNRVMRGGSFVRIREVYCRSAARGVGATGTDIDLGFRVVLVYEP